MLYAMELVRLAMAVTVKVATVKDVIVMGAANAENFLRKDLQPLQHLVQVLEGSFQIT